MFHSKSSALAIVVSAATLELTALFYFFSRFFSWAISKGRGPGLDWCWNCCPKGPSSSSWGASWSCIHVRDRGIYGWEDEAPPLQVSVCVGEEMVVSSFRAWKKGRDWKTGIFFFRPRTDDRAYERSVTYSKWAKKIYHSETLLKDLENRGLFCTAQWLTWFNRLTTYLYDWSMITISEATYFLGLKTDP